MSPHSEPARQSCRFCKTDLHRVFIDLGTAPPSNALLNMTDCRAPERFYPLRVLVCDACRLVQTEDYAKASELFSTDYVYFSSFSKSWLDHARRYANTMIERFDLSGQSTVVEIAANDGYLLQYFQAAGVPCFGIEPTQSTAEAARRKGIEIVEEFFGEALGTALAVQDRSADLIVANNVLAHVPDILDFVRGFTALLKTGGVATFEFPHLLNLVAQVQFDTIYHEHYSYLSLDTVEKVFEVAGLRVFDVECLSTHGGSLRVFAERADVGTRQESIRLHDLRQEEADAGVAQDEFYDGLQTRAEAIKFDLLDHLIAAKRAGRTVAAYGASAKGATLFNFAGIRSDLIAYVVDQNPAKQNKLMPGSRIPIFAPAQLDLNPPDEILITPWNIAQEITAQLKPYADNGVTLLRAVPELEIIRS